MPDLRTVKAFRSAALRLGTLTAEDAFFFDFFLGLDFPFDFGMAFFLATPFGEVAFLTVFFLLTVFLTSVSLATLFLAAATLRWTVRAFAGNFAAFLGLGWILVAESFGLRFIIQDSEIEQGLAGRLVHLLKL